MHVLAADEMKPVVVMNHPAMNVDAREDGILALDHAHGVKRAVLQKNVAHDKISASIKQQMIRAPSAADARRGRNASFRAKELMTLPVNRARSFNRNVFCVDRIEQPDIAVAEC